MNEPVKYMIERVGCEFDSEECQYHFKHLDTKDIEKTREIVLKVFETIALDTYEIHYRPTPYSYKIAKRIIEEMQILREWKKVRKTTTMNRDGKILFVADVLNLTRKNVKDTLERVKNGEGYAPRLTKPEI